LTGWRDLSENLITFGDTVDNVVAEFGAMRGISLRELATLLATSDILRYDTNDNVFFRRWPERLLLMVETEAKMKKWRPEKWKVDHPSHEDARLS
ncbi:hypothetical protein MKZ38_009616, partial [Zalerion maritima]